MTALGEAYDGDNSFADSLEAFGGGQDDPINVSIGGPIVSKFINAFRELANYKELLRSQVEHLLVGRLMHSMTVDLQDVKESRRRFDKAINAYNQAHEKFVSLKKNTRGDIVAEVEEDLQNSKSAFERRRFNLGYDLLSHLEPFIHQVLTYAQQSKELANAEQHRLEKRIQEFRTQPEIETFQASSNIEHSISACGIHFIGLNLDKNIEAIMQSSTNGEGSRQYTGSAEHISGAFARFRSRNNRSSSFSEETLGCHTVDLRTSKIKMDAEDTDLRLCFRIISPLKIYALGARSSIKDGGGLNALERAMEKGPIADEELFILLNES